jgi:hypothetical protein
MVAPRTRMIFRMTQQCSKSIDSRRRRYPQTRWAKECSKMRCEERLSTSCECVRGGFGVPRDSVTRLCQHPELHEVLHEVLHDNG